MGRMTAVFLIAALWLSPGALAQDDDAPLPEPAPKIPEPAPAAPAPADPPPNDPAPVKPAPVDSGPFGADPPKPKPVDAGPFDQNDAPAKNPAPAPGAPPPGAPPGPQPGYGPDGHMYSGTPRTGIPFLLHAGVGFGSISEGIDIFDSAVGFGGSFTLVYQNPPYGHMWWGIEAGVNAGSFSFPNETITVTQGIDSATGKLSLNETILDFSAGARLSFALTQDESVVLYGGAGISSISVDVDASADSDTGTFATKEEADEFMEKGFSASDSTTGFYLRGGMSFRISKRSYLAMDARQQFGEVELEFEDNQTLGTQKQRIDNFMFTIAVQVWF